MSTYIVTVSKITPDGDKPGITAEIFRQTLEEFNLSKFVVALNKTPRTRKATKPAKEAATK